MLVELVTVEVFSVSLLHLAESHRDPPFSSMNAQSSAWLRVRPVELNPDLQIIFQQGRDLKLEARLALGQSRGEGPDNCCVARPEPNLVARSLSKKPRPQESEQMSPTPGTQLGAPSPQPAPKRTTQAPTT